MDVHVTYTMLYIMIFLMDLVYYTTMITYTDINGMVYGIWYNGFS